jgi:prevent-host-death family protein
MTRYTAAKFRENCSEAINQVAYSKDRVVLTRHGKDLAAVVPIEDYRLLERLEDEIDLREAKKALLDAEKNGTVSFDELERRIEKRYGKSATKAKASVKKKKR